MCCISIPFGGVAQPGSASGLGPEGRRFKSCHSDHHYEKSKNLYPKQKAQCNQVLEKPIKWILEFKTKDPTKNPLMGWESSSDTLTELKLEFFN